ncbi:MAG: hypothetical protein IKZ87_08965 [Actinomycetaceae bacterium]|nr:hypothetical protein [Actinomycetaceae bacterium]
MAGSRPKELGRDVPAIFEAYALLEASLMSVGRGSHDIVVSTDGNETRQELVLPPCIQARVVVSPNFPSSYAAHANACDKIKSRPPALALLKRMAPGMLEYHAQWTSEIARSLPLMQGSSRSLGFDIKRSAGVLGLFYTEEYCDNGLCYIMPDWYGAFWLDGTVEQCIAFPMLRSVFTRLPDGVDWVDTIAARIKDCDLVPTPAAWKCV